jgi:hypothetical protein
MVPALRLIVHRAGIEPDRNLLNLRRDSSGHTGVQICRVSLIGGQAN